MINFRPLGDKVLVERYTNKPDSVIITSSEEKSQYGHVIFAGPGRTSPEGKLIKIGVRVGDKVFFGKYAGTEVEENYLLLREEEILGIVESI